MPMHHTAVVAVTYLQESQKVREEVSYRYAKPNLKTGIPELCGRSN